MKKIYQDEMTSKERSEALDRGEAVDRLPCSPIMGETMGPMFGIYPREHNHSAELMTQVEVGVYRRFKCDGAGIGTGLRGVAEAMGTELVYPEKRVSYVKEQLVKNEADLAKLRPADPHRDGRLPIILKALKMIDDEVGDEVGVGTDIAGPFTVASQIRGVEDLLRDTHKNPRMVHELLQVVTDSNLRFIDAACEMGYSVGFSDPVASTSMISTKIFKEFAKPYLQQCVDRVVKWRGSGVNLHICGKSKAIWNDMVDLGVSTLSIDNVESLQECRDLVGDRVCLVGNVPPVEALRMGSEKDVIEASRECIEIGWDNPGGYVLSTGCQIPIGTKAENVDAMMFAARKYGMNYRLPKYR